MLSFTGSVTDADGIDDLLCSARISHNQSELAELQVTLQPQNSTSADLAFQFPTTGILSNLTLEVEVTCIDSWSQSNSSKIEFTLLPETVCDTCQPSTLDDGAVKTSFSSASIVMFVFVLLLGLLGLTLLLKKPKEVEDPLWVSQEEPEEIPSKDSAELKKPTGWSDEQYRLWLEGEMPEGWTLVQWVVFSDEQIQLLESQGNQN